MSESAVARVPGTTANLGPGLDCLGIALDLHNRVTIRRDGGRAPDAMVDDAAARFFAASGARAFDFAWSIAGDVPCSRGLGSSVTVRLGTLHALNELAGRPLGAQRIFELCAEAEGHPDNAAPAAFGGFAVARAGGSALRFDVEPALRFVLLIPDFEVRTADARRLLPESAPLADAVANLSNTAMLVAAFASRRYGALRGVFDDFLHQPYREPLVPGLRAVIAAGVAAGALGGWLSGSGSTIACVTLDDPSAVAKAMLAAWPAASARTVVTAASNEGVQIE